MATRRRLAAFAVVMAGSIVLTSAEVKAEPYGGFNSCNTKTVYIDYGQRYVPRSERMIYSQSVPTTTVVRETPAVEYVYADPYRSYAAPVYAPVPYYAGPQYYPAYRGYGYGHRSYHRYGHHDRLYGHGNRHGGFGFSLGSNSGHHGRHGGFSFGFSRGHHNSHGRSHSGLTRGHHSSRRGSSHFSRGRSSHNGRSHFSRGRSSHRGGRSFGHHGRSNHGSRRGSSRHHRR